jgi:hypothetical protein
MLDLLSIFFSNSLIQTDLESELRFRKYCIFSIEKILCIITSKTHQFLHKKKIN